MRKAILIAMCSLVVGLTFAKLALSHPAQPPDKGFCYHGCNEHDAK